MYGKSLFWRVVRPSNIRFYQKDSTKKLLEFLADMPKSNSERIAVAQRQRQNITKKSEKYGCSTVYLQVLGSGARGVPNTLYLFTDQKRYLFNCGECTQRLAHEHKVKLSRLDHIFVTSKTWRNIGGLPGLSLTLQDVGVPNITLHGPEGLDELYPATKRFVIMKDMNVVMAKCSPSEDFVDNVMKVKYVLLGPHDDILAKDLKPATKKFKLNDSLERDFEEFKEFITDETDYYRHDLRGLEMATRPMEQKKYVKERPKPKPTAERSADPMMKKTEKVLHELQKKSHCTVAYICTLKKRLGTLDLAKCVELGVKPGPMLGQLKSGQDVVLPDGTLIRSKDVKTPDDPGPVFIVLEVPELSYLKKAEFSAHFDDGVNPPENIPSLIVHYTPPHVLHDAAYKSFMKLFGPSARHLVMSEQNSCLGSEAVHRTQHKLHLLDPDIFPLLRDVSVPAVWNAQPPLAKTNSPIRLQGLDELKNKIALAQFQNIINMEGSCKGDCRSAGACADDADVEPLELIAARTLTMYHLRPKKQLDRSAEPKLHIQDYIQESMDVDGFVPSLEQFRRLVDSMRYARTGSQAEFPKVVFLGTGSCIPSKTRNTSAIVIHVDENRSMLLDCGEGTFGQLLRFYGPKRVNAFLRTLKAIYISHLHADHHIGLIGVLQARREAHAELRPHTRPDPLHLLAPGQIVSWLSVYDQQFERIRADFTLIPNQSLLMDGVKESELTSAVLADIGAYQIQTCLVAHCPNAFGVSIEIDNHKITYSGDTIPCEALVKLGENSTLLIHEATMEDELAEEARMKMHSTTTQAIQIGRQMNARYTLLTHFSQRYARLPRLNPNILNDNNSVGIAFDNMQITMSDLELLPHMYAPLQLMFAEHCVEMELKAAHRARQRERDRQSSPLTATCAEARCRRVSPGCRGALSAPTRSPATYYRESNASRLRQEMKGMTIVGGIGSPRSHSTSPVKRRLSRSPSPIVPKPRRDVSLDMRLDVIAAPRTISETSTSNVSKDGERKPPSSVPSGSVVDTRSRTLSSVSRAVDYVAKENYVKKVPPPPAAPNIGYGRPLLTPMNKRLQLRRDVLPSASLTSEKLPPTVRTKSPMTQKAENRLCPSPTSSNKHNLGISRLPVCSVSGSKCPSVTCNVVKTERSPMSKSPVGNKETKPNSSYTKIKSANPGTSRSSVIKSSESNVSRCNSDRSSLQKSKASDQQNTESKSSGKKSKNISIELTKMSMPSFRETNDTRSLKQQILNTPNCVMSCRPSSGLYSNRSFKPQLEDIKSSFILLTKKTQNKQKNHNDSKLPQVTKPKPIDDEARRRQLNEIKKKFQSRGFYNESKYDKIEGLNWISWKQTLGSNNSSVF